MLGSQVGGSLYHYIRHYFSSLWHQESKLIKSQIKHQLSWCYGKVNGLFWY